MEKQKTNSALWSLGSLFMLALTTSTFVDVLAKSRKISKRKPYYYRGYKKKLASEPELVRAIFNDLAYYADKDDVSNGKV